MDNVGAQNPLDPLRNIWKSQVTFGEINPRRFSAAENSQRVRGVPSGRNCLGWSSRVPIVRTRWLLRFLDGQARNQTLPEDATSRDARCPARGLDMVLWP